MTDVYEPPMLIELGDFAVLTRGFGIGSQSDIHGYYLAMRNRAMSGHRRTWFVVLPDTEAGFATAAVWGTAKCPALHHPSGRPWILGDWPADGAVTVQAGPVTPAVFGASDAGTHRLRRHAAVSVVLTACRAVLRLQLLGVLAGDSKVSFAGVELPCCCQIGRPLRTGPGSPAPADPARGRKPLRSVGRAYRPESGSFSVGPCQTASGGGTAPVETGVNRTGFIHDEVIVWSRTSRTEAKGSRRMEVPL
ncbi:lasso RiPP family leader peptide-containing protein [Streptomyces sp. NBC_01362]|uniref:lasso RiPP family leader peptide-containing protein n=1 Tax=Streptomyces sp. NBC_01362 TaxID=2903839 RepID=UPI003FCDCD91